MVEGIDMENILETNLLKVQNSEPEHKNTSRPTSKRKNSKQKRKETKINPKMTLKNLNVGSAVTDNLESDDSDDDDVEIYRVNATQYTSKNRGQNIHDTSRTSSHNSRGSVQYIHQGAARNDSMMSDQRRNLPQYRNNSNLTNDSVSSGFGTKSKSNFLKSLRNSKG